MYISYLPFIPRRCNKLPCPSNSFTPSLTLAKYGMRTPDTDRETTSVSTEKEGREVKPGTKVH